MDKENVLSQNMSDYSKVIEIMQIILIGISALIVPTFLAGALNSIFGQNSFIASHSQIIVGSIVNMSLITAAINVKGWRKIMSIITLPSISTILGGYVFKTASIYMAYMIPAIWIGNFALVYLYKLLLLKKKINYFLTGVISVVVKVGVIFLGFSILNAIGIFPQKLVANLQTAMSWTQAVTATIAMFVTYTIYIGNKKILEKK